ncbi:Alpha/Beta hydrolase protein [Xylariaceae sp. FL0016]|nr:Alpha/Beta hydrolase protein [Xylariaceae sp. FL0016]
MALDALTPGDPRVKHDFMNVGGDITYHYMTAGPEGTPKVTAFLFHGWPDLAMGWRYQVPYLLRLGVRVVVPDMLGYGQTSSPDAEDEYSFKKMSAHMAQLIHEVNESEPVLLIAHDWGAAFAWRLAMYHPKLIRGVISFCIPFFPPARETPSLETMAELHPIIRYQVQIASGETQRIVSKTPAGMRAFLNSVFDGVTPGGLPGFDLFVGIVEERYLDVASSPLLSTDIVDHYVQEFARHGLHGPANWYRTYAINGDDEKPLAEPGVKVEFEFPAMVVVGGRTALYNPALTDGMEAYFPAGLRKELLAEASHWVMADRPVESNKLIGEFINQVLS